MQDQLTPAAPAPMISISHSIFCTRSSSATVSGGMSQFQRVAFPLLDATMCVSLSCPGEQVACVPAPAGSKVAG